MSKPSRALFIGRFQPFHKGHLRAIQHILERSQEIVISIGSAQYSHTHKNPFTAGERVTMIRLALDEAKVNPGSYYIIPIRDVHIHRTWVSHVVSLTPKFDSVYTNEPLTTTLFRDEGYPLHSIPFYDRDVYSATEIRERLLKGGDWQSLVPDSVADYLTSIAGVERIRELARSDNPALQKS